MVSLEGYAHLYLSPHLDDAVFSCGGRMWRQAGAGGRVTVVTVFGGAPEPEAPLSPYAQELHARWGQPIEAVRQRQAEDVKALSLLGAEPIHWPYLDCIYRRAPEGDFCYVSEDALWGQIHTSDADIVGQLAHRMMELPLASDGRFYVPLGIGNHVDHRIVRRAAEASGRPLTYYEDFPYAQDPRAVKAALKQSQWEPELVPLSEQALEAKVAAIACYGSQVSSFWGGRDNIDATVRAFAEQTGGGEPAERYWRSTRI
jgi:LmbE family N-acetylglucosaminyl deacetylase